MGKTKNLIFYSLNGQVEFTGWANVHPVNLLFQARIRGGGAGGPGPPSSAKKKKKKEGRKGKERKKEKWKERERDIKK